MKRTPLLITAMICLTVIIVSATNAPAQDKPGNNATHHERRFEIKAVTANTRHASYLVLVDQDTGDVWTKNSITSISDWFYAGKPVAK